MKPKKHSLSWRKEPNKKGLNSIGQGPRGAILKVDGIDLARVYAKNIGWTYRYEGWYVVCRDLVTGYPVLNTCEKPSATLEEAKILCEANVREQLARHDESDE